MLAVAAGLTLTAGAGAIALTTDAANADATTATTSPTVTSLTEERQPTVLQQEDRFGLPGLTEDDEGVTQPLSPPTTLTPRSRQGTTRGS